MASLPQVGVQAVVLGMAAFTANSRSVEAQIAMMGAASYRLEKATGHSFGGIAGALQAMSAASKDASRVAIAAAQAQATASAVAALKINVAQESVVAASQLAAAKVAAAHQSAAAAELAYMTTMAQSFDTVLVARLKSTAAMQAAQTAQLRADRSMALSAEANAAVVIKSEIAKNAAIRATAHVREAEALASGPGSLSVVGGVRAAEAKAAAVAAQMHAAALAEEAKAAAVAAAAMDKLALSELREAGVAGGAAVAAANSLAAAKEAATAKTVAADIALVTTTQTAAAAITASNAQMVASETAAGIAITAAEAEKAAVTEASAAQQIAADNAVKASKFGLMAAIVATTAIIVAGLLAISAAAIIMSQKYGRALAFTGAVSGATSVQIKALDAAHMQLSRTATTSAGALNEISAELLKAGQSVESVLSGTLRATNDLVVASAGELKAADAAVLMQVAMEGFGVSATRAADATTVAVQKSTLTFGEFADAIRQGGANAANAGMDFDTFSTVIGVMGLTINSGSEAATSLRVMLQRLQNPTAEATTLLNDYKISLYDANGAARPFRDVIADLSAQFDDQAIKTGKLTAQERDHALAVIFGQRASKGAIALIRQGTEEYDKMSAAVKETNAAQKLANQLLQPTGAQLEIIRNNVEDLGTAYGKGLDPFINKAVSSTLAWLQTLDLAKITAFGEAVGSTVYNAFANFGNLLSTQVTPKMNVFQTAMFTMVGVVTVLAGRVALAWTVATTKVVASFALMAARAAWSAGVIYAQMVGRAVVAMALFAATTTASMAASAAAIYVTMLPALTAFGAAVIGSIGPILLIVAAIAATIALVAVAWENNWLDMQTVVKNALEWMQPALGSFFNWFGTQVNKMFGSLSDAMEASDAPMQENDVRKKYGGKGVDAHFATTTPPAVAAFNSIKKAAGDAGAAALQFGKDAIEAFNAAKDFKMPSEHDFAADVKKAWDAAADARDAALGKGKSGGAPAGDTDAGDYPTKDDVGSEAAKKLESALAKADEIIQDFNDDVKKALSGLSTDVLNLYAEAFKSINEALYEHEQAVEKAMETASKSEAKLYADKALADSIEGRKKALNDTLEFENNWRSQQLASGELWHQRQLEDDKNYYDALRRLREDAFDEEQAVVSRARDLLRDNENIAYQASLDARESANAAKYDALERDLKAEQDAREASLKIIQDAEERALEESQDRRERALKSILDAEKLARDQKHDLTKLDSEDARDRAAAQAEYDKQIAGGVKASIAKTRLDEALGKIGNKTKDDKAKLTEDHAWEQDTAKFEDSQESRMLALKAQFNTEDLALDKKHTDEKLVLETEFNKKREELNAESDRKSDELRDTIDKESRERSRKRDEEDRLFSEQQERDKNLFSAKENAKALSDARTLEDKELERKRKNDLADNAFKAEQDAKRQELEKKLEAEDQARVVAAIWAEYDENIAAADKTLADEQKKTREKLAQDILDLKQNMSDRIDTIREGYMDKLEDIMDDANISAKASEVTNTIAIGLYAIRDAAQSATDKLAEALGAARELKNAQASRDAIEEAHNATQKPGGWYQGNYYDTDEAFSEAGGNLDNKQYGGIVPGRVGSPVTMKAHGGEYYEGIGAGGVAMTAVRAAEAMLSRGIGGASQTTNNTEYNVNANYGHVQPEGSIRRDLSALVTLTR